MTVATGGLRAGRTAILLGMLVIATIAAVAYGTALAARERVVRDAEKSLASLVATLGARVGKTMAAADAVLDAVENALVGVKMNDAAIFKRRVRDEDVSRMLRDKSRDVEKAGVVTLVSPTGELLSTSRTFPTPVQTLAPAEVVSAFAQDPKLVRHVGAPARDGDRDQLLLTLGRRFGDSGGRLLGILRIGIAPDELLALQAETLAVLGAGATLSLYRTDATLMAHHPSDEGRLGKPDVDGFAHTALLVAGNGDKGAATANRGLAAARGVEGYPLVLTVAVPAEAYQARWRAELFRIIAWAGSLIVLVLAALALTRAYRMRRQRAAASTVEIPGHTGPREADESPAGFGGAAPTVQREAVAAPQEAPNDQPEGGQIRAPSANASAGLQGQLAPPAVAVPAEALAVETDMTDERVMQAPTRRLVISSPGVPAAPSEDAQTRPKRDLEARASPSATTQGASNGTASLFDYAQALSETNQQLVGMIAPAALEQYPLDMAAIDGALTAGDAREAARAAHSMSGTLGRFKARPAVAILRAIEKHARTGNIDQARLEFTALGPEVAALSRALAAYAS